MADQVINEVENEVAEILRRIELLRTTDALSIEEKIEIAQQLIAIVEAAEATSEVIL